MRRRSTLVLGDSEVDISVQEFSIQEASSLELANLGVHRKHIFWKVQVGRDTMPISIAVTVEKGTLKYPEIRVDCNGSQEFPKGVGQVAPKSRIKEDFHWKLPFRGTIRGIGIPENFLIRPSGFGVADQWYPCTLNFQRKDGCFEAIAYMPDGMGDVRQVYMPSVRAEDLKYAGTRDPLVIQERNLILTVPKADPMEATLSVDYNEMVTCHFARQTPPQGKEAKVTFKVSADRRQVFADVGHSVFTQFLDNQARLVRHLDESPFKRNLKEVTGITKPTLKESWEIQLGPFATHTIEVEKRQRSNIPNSHLNKIVQVKVDGSVLVEASPEDLQCPTSEFVCKFQLKGMKTMCFDIFETTSNGRPLDTKAVINKYAAYKHECLVVVKDDKFERYATLTVDGTDAKNLPLRHADQKEPHINVTPEVLMVNYGIVLPFKVRDDHNGLTSKPPDGSLGGMNDGIMRDFVETFEAINARSTPAQGAYGYGNGLARPRRGWLEEIFGTCCNCDGSTMHYGEEYLPTSAVQLSVYDHMAPNYNQMANHFTNDPNFATTGPMQGNAFMGPGNNGMFAGNGMVNNGMVNNGMGYNGMVNNGMYNNGMANNVGMYR